MYLVLLEETADSRIRSENTGDEPGAPCNAKKYGNAQKPTKRSPYVDGGVSGATGVI